MTNLATILDRAAAAHPERAALLFEDERHTYAELELAANRVANLLVAHGVEPGDKIALSCPNLPHFIIVYFGILKVGGTVVPLNVLLKAREVAYHLQDSDAVAYFAFDGAGDLPIGTAARQAFEATPSCLHLFLPGTDEYADQVAAQSTDHHTVDVDDEATAVILYTSGTTGQPKGAELRHRNMRDNALTGRTLFAIEESRPDTYLCVLPLFHSFGQTVIQNGALASGGTVVMLPRFDPDAALALMQRHGVTFFAGVPTMYWALLESLAQPVEGRSVDLDRIRDTLRVAVAGGAAMHADLHHRASTELGVSVLEGYGLSETSPMASMAPWGATVRVGSIGVPIPGVEMRLLDAEGGWEDADDEIGEIAIRGHNVMKGYYGRPEATAEAIRDGWFRSGDLARRDADGFYYIVDRSKDMIIRGGFNVYPREIEEVLLAHPAVSLAAVVGVPHESHGEEVKAFVIRSRGHHGTDEADLIAWAREQLAAYKYPRVVEFVDELPMTSTGKILKRELH